MKPAAATSSGAWVASRAPSRWARAAKPRGSTTAASSLTRKSPSSTTAPTHPSTPVTRRCESHLISRPTKHTLSPSYTHTNPPLLAASQGNMQTLADGNAVVGYGGVPAISEFATGGTLLFDAHLPFDMAFYRAFRFPWSGRPSSPAAVLANLNNTGEETIVHMSWNGASEVASWRVLAGEHRGSLVSLTTIPASGFESSTILPKKYAYVATQALDGAGHVLGTSLTTQRSAMPLRCQARDIRNERNRARTDGRRANKADGPAVRWSGRPSALQRSGRPAFSKPVFWSACAAPRSWSRRAARRGGAGTARCFTAAPCHRQRGREDGQQR